MRPSLTLVIVGESDKGNEISELTLERMFDTIAAHADHLHLDSGVQAGRCPADPAARSGLSLDPARDDKRSSRSDK